MDKRTQIMPIIIDDKNTIYANVSLMGGEENVGLKLLSLEKVLEPIKAFSKKLSEIFEYASPEKASIEFSIELTAKSGELAALLLDAESKGGIKINLEWKNPK